MLNNSVYLRITFFANKSIGLSSKCGFENKVCLAENAPSDASVSRILRDDLGYSYKIIRQISTETNRPDIQEKRNRYEKICPIDVNRLHFFYESSVVITSGNRKRGHSAIGKPAFEMQKYASNATFTLNLLHNISGVSHFNILRGPSNGGGGGGGGQGVKIYHFPYLPFRLPYLFALLSPDSRPCSTNLAIVRRQTST